MNPLPISWCLGGAGVAALLGAWGGWTVRDWKADGDALKGLKTAITTVEKQRGVIDSAAQTYEEDRTSGTSTSTVRESTIREIYRTAPPVPVSCAPGDGTVRVLDAALADAAARAAGQSPGGLPATADPADAADRPGAGDLGSSADRGLW